MANDLSTKDLLARQPSQYLKSGFLDAKGKLRPELTGLDAFAVAMQLRAGDASPDEVALTLEALKQQLALRTQGPADERFADAVQDALAMVSGMIGQPNSIVIEGWLGVCGSFIKTAGDIEAFLQFFTAIAQQYAALLGVSPEAEQAP